MARQSTRYFRFAPARRSRLAQSYHLRCESLESRTTPALFDVGDPEFYTGLSNNGCVAVADFNKDGRLDAVLANFGTNYESGAGSTITVLYALEAGGFTRQGLNTTGRNISFVTVADINGDTYPDILATNANQQTSVGTVSVFKNTNGNLSLDNTFSTFSYNPAWVGLADVTGDGELDAIVASFGRDDGSGENIEGNNMTIFQGNGDFTFQASPVTTLAPEIQFIPTAAAVVDFDGDGILDIAATVPGVPLEFGQPQPEGGLYVFKGTGAGGFNAPNILGTGGALPINIQSADLDANGKLDLVIANAGDPNANPEFKDDSVGVLMNFSNPGSISFGVINPLTTNTYGPFATAIADYDLDGNLDIASVNYGGQALSPQAFVSFYKGNGTGGFTPGPSPATFNTNTGFGGGQYLAAGDFDGNTTPDLIVAHATSMVTMLDNTSVPQQVEATTTNLVSLLNPSTVGQQVTFTATVDAVGGTVVGGTVQFFRNGSPMGSPVALVNEQAQLQTSSIPTGTHNITATYSGAVGFTGSTSNTVSQQVNPVIPAPTVTINQGNGQADPTSTGPINFTVQFSEPVTGFDSSDIAFSGTVGGTLSAAISGSGADYTVAVSGMTGSGTVVASVKPNGAINSSAIGNAASTSTDNTVTFDGVAPSVTINQAVGQADPTSVPSIKFDVQFSESVTGFTAADVVLGGTAGGTLTVDVTGSLGTYLVTVTGMTNGGTVIATIPAGAATDTVGNTSTASSSTDNTVTFLTTSSLGFSQAVFNASELDATNVVTITVTRTGPTGGAVSVNYQTADGTAHSGGLASGGQDDYLPTSGTLSWADGEGGDRTFTITVQPDALNEGKELINLTLTNPSGIVTLDQPTAVLAIAPSDGQVINAAPVLPQRPFAKFTDTDGDVATVRLGGRQGTATVYRTDPDGNGFGPIELIHLDGTLPDPLRPRAVLTVGVTKGKFTVDGGTIGLGAVTGSGLRLIQARRANLNGDGINLNGYLGALVIGNVVNEADITTGATSNPLQKTRINALAIQHGTDINVGAHVSSLTALSFGNGSFRAPSAGQIIVREVMSADVTLTGVGVDPSRYTLGALRVRGTVIDSHIEVNGHVRAVTVGSFRDSQLFAGYTGSVVPNPAGFTSPALVGSFRTTAKFDAFQNSHVIATAFKNVFLSSLDSTNGTDFGFYADSSLGSIRVGGLLPFSYNATLPTPQRRDQFEVKIV